MNREAPEWWPPKLGDKLRHTASHSAGPGRIKYVDAVLHVVSVFEDKDGEQRVVTAEWFPGKQRWNYEIFWWYQAALGMIWPDGTEKPIVT